MIETKTLANYLPGVTRPTYKLVLNTKLQWTLIALLCYLVLANITVWGVQPLTPEQMAQFHFYEMVLGAKFGSIVTLGIGPIVTAGIVLQLLVGSKIIPWDMTEPENRRKFQTWNKFLAICFSFIEAAAFVLGGMLPLVGGTEIMLAVMLQIAAGGIIVLLLDELVQKWGFGSGVSLFILAGVGTQVVVQALSPLHTELPNPANPGSYVGRVWNFLSNAMAGIYAQALLNLLPLLSTVLLFLLIVFTSTMAIRIPIAYTALRGFTRTWDLRLFYTSNIPVIFAAALLANISIVGRFGAMPTGLGLSCGVLGCFDEAGNPVSGAVYYLSAPNLFFTALAGHLNLDTLLRALCYGTFMMGTAALFSYFWVVTTGMDAGSVAKQLEKFGFHIPGYRSDAKTMEAVLNRYIPVVTLLGGVGIGFLAAVGDFTGVLATGTGLLLGATIVQNYYEQLRRERTEEMHPVLRQLIGE